MMKSKLRQFVDKYMGEEYGHIVDSPAFFLVLVICLFAFVVSVEATSIFVRWAKSF